MARTAKKKIELLDEGISVVEDIDSIDVTGLGADATAVDQDATLDVPFRGVNVTTLTVSATAPTSPTLNDLWVDIT